MKQIVKAKVVFIALTAMALSSPAQSETGCAHDDFYAFLTEFQNTPSEQKNMSAESLTMTSLVKRDSAVPARNIQTQSKDDLDWPILPSLTELNRKDFRVRIYQSTPLKAELNAFTEEPTEDFIIWYFEKNPCWTFTGQMDGTFGQ